MGEDRQMINEEGEFDGKCFFWKYDKDKNDKPFVGVVCQDADGRVIFNRCYCTEASMSICVETLQALGVPGNTDNEVLGAAEAHLKAGVDTKFATVMNGDYCNVAWIGEKKAKGMEKDAFLAAVLGGNAPATNKDDKDEMPF